MASELGGSDATHRGLFTVLINNGLAASLSCSALDRLALDDLLNKPHSAQAGHVARPCPIEIPIDNSHGWEIVNLDAICNVAGILVEYLHDKITPVRA